MLLLERRVRPPGFSSGPSLERAPRLLIAPRMAAPLVNLCCKAMAVSVLRDASALPSCKSRQVNRSSLIIARSSVSFTFLIERTMCPQLCPIERARSPFSRLGLRPQRAEAVASTFLITRRGCRFLFGSISPGGGFPFGEGSGSAAATGPCHPSLSRNLWRNAASAPFGASDHGPARDGRGCLLAFSACARAQTRRAPGPTPSRRHFSTPPEPDAPPSSKSGPLHSSYIFSKNLSSTKAKEGRFSPDAFQVTISDFEFRLYRGVSV